MILHQERIQALSGTGPRKKLRVLQVAELKEWAPQDAGAQMMFAESRNVSRV